jgi:hypothetical protein
VKFSDIFSRKKPTLDEQLAVLAECGIKLREGANRDELAAVLRDDRKDAWSYEDVLIAMGNDSESDDGVSLSDDIWYLDTECIEGDGSYARIIRRLGALTRGELDFRDVTDHVDVDAEEAWVEFVLDGEKIHWDMTVKDDWVDGDVFSNVARLLEKKKSSRRLTNIFLFGQDLLIGCSTEEEFRRLKKDTGLDVKWLKP